jgi:muramidase (phage lysozyme)
MIKRSLTQIEERLRAKLAEANNLSDREPLFPGSGWGGGPDQEPVMQINPPLPGGGGGRGSSAAPGGGKPSVWRVGPDGSRTSVPPPLRKPAMSPAEARAAAEARKRSEELLTGQGFKEKQAPNVWRKGEQSAGSAPAAPQEKLIAQAKQQTAATGEPTIAITNPTMSRLLDKLFPEKAKRIEPTMGPPIAITPGAKDRLGRIEPTMGPPIAITPGAKDRLGRIEPTLDEAAKEEIDYDALAQDPRVRTMLDIIARAEGADYDTIVGSTPDKPKKFTDFSKHPMVTGLVTKQGPSKAAGRYQFTGGTWKRYVKKLGLPDFSPASQDKAAIALLHDKGALKHVLDGKFVNAIKKTGSTWTSLPSSDIKQGRGPRDWKWVERTLADLGADTLAAATMSGAAQAADEIPRPKPAPKAIAPKPAPKAIAPKPAPIDKITPDEEAKQEKRMTDIGNTWRQSRPNKPEATDKKPIGTMVQPDYSKYNVGDLGPLEKIGPGQWRSRNGKIVTDAPELENLPTVPKPESFTDKLKRVAPPALGGKGELVSQVFGDRKKTTPVVPEPAKAEPAKAEPAKAEPAKAEPAKAEPAKVPKLDPAYELGTAEYDARMEKLQTAAGDKFSRERAARLKAAAEKPADKIELQRDQAGLVKAKRELSDFERAFAAARAEKGPGATFSYTDPRTGKTELKTTAYKGEKSSAKAATSAAVPVAMASTNTDADSVAQSATAQSDQEIGRAHV